MTDDIKAKEARLRDAGASAWTTALAIIDAYKAEVERLRAAIRHTHVEHCHEGWTSHKMHAPGCLLYEIDEQEYPGAEKPMKPEEINP